MKFFELSITGIVLRLYLLMAVVLVAGFTGYWSVALLAVPIFLSTMLGVSFGESPAEGTAAPKAGAAPEALVHTLERGVTPARLAQAA